MRGHSALLGALDAELAIEGAADQERILRTGKVRDGDGFQDLFAFTLKAVVLGIEQDGEEVKSCVVKSTDTANARRKRNAAGLGKNQKAVLRVLEERGGRMVRSTSPTSSRTTACPGTECTTPWLPCLSPGC